MPGAATFDFYPQRLSGGASAPSRLASSSRRPCAGPGAVSCSTILPCPTSLSRRRFAGLLAAGAVAGASGCGSEPPEPEQAASKPLKIVDPHVHVWVNDAAYPWPGGEQESPQRRRHGGNAARLDGRPRRRSHPVIVHPFHYRWDCRYVGDVMKKYPRQVSRRLPRQPRARDAADELSKWTEEWGFKGVRLSPSVSEVGNWITNNELMDPIWDRAEQLGVPMLILTRTGRLPDVQKHIEKHPDMDVVDRSHGRLQADGSAGRTPEVADPRNLPAGLLQDLAHLEHLPTNPIRIAIPGIK